MTPDTDGLHAIANTENEDRQADIVFVHGLRGKSHETWRHGEIGDDDHFFWPEELGEDLPDCGIWSVGYPAGFSNWAKRGMILKDRGGNIALRLVNGKLGGRPIIFVTHSMGGLVVKSLVVGSQTLPDRNRKLIAKAVSGIVFCGTPHRGAAFATAADALGFFFRGSQEYVKQMKLNAAGLDNLHDEFIEWQRQNPVPIDSYAENLDLYGTTRVVSRSSANPNIQRYSVHLVDEDHLSLVKPPDGDHIVYAGVLRFIRNALKDPVIKRQPEPVLAVKQPAPASTPVDPPAASEPSRGDWLTVQSYGLSSHFTGRAKEREMLTEWLSDDKTHPLLSLRALGGFGKSALAWYWIMNDVEPNDWPKVVWWSFYGGENVSFDNFVCKTLDYLSGGEIKLTKPTANDVRTLVDKLHEPGTLLVLDGFERLLRAYGGMNAAYQGDESGEKPTDRDCVSPLAETFLRDIATLPDIRSKVLLTTRLRPHVLETRDSGLLAGSHEEVLEQMQPDDAVAYFRAQKIRGTDTEIKAACEPCGYHPLSLSLLAGLIVKDLKKPRDIVVAERVDVSGDLIQRKHHVLEAAYNGLTPERKSLLSHIAAFRNTMGYEAIETVAKKALPSVATFDKDLKDLVDRGLVNHDTVESQFDLHPIVRRYAYDRLSGNDRTAAHAEMRDYFAAVTPPKEITCLEDLTPVIELYHHTVKAGQYDEARTLFRDRLTGPLHFRLGAHQLTIDLLRSLFPDGGDSLPRLKDESAQGWTLNTLANSYCLSGQPGRAVPLFEQAIAMAEKQDNKRNVAVGSGNLALQHSLIGALRDAETNNRRRTAICLEAEYENDEAIGHQELGRLLAYRGVYAESGAALATALKMFEKQTDVQSQCIVRSYGAIRELLLHRSNSDPESDHIQSALKSAQGALELADETANDSRFVYTVHDYVRAHWLLGAAYCAYGRHEEAERHLNEAIERCRKTSVVEHEADILIDLARLRAATGDPTEATRLAVEALVITDRSGYVLQGADAHLELTKLALADNDKPTALDHARLAKKLATCDGPPDYTYKAAYDEACALLDKLQSA
jgi:tetratricopeptide (TPR) repeat protein